MAAVSVLRDGHRLGIHWSGWRKHRWTRQDRSSCALFAIQIPMASGRMLRRTRKLLCPCSNSRSPTDGHRVMFFPRKAFDKRTPGLFKVEWCGDGFVALCSKTYYCFGATDKYSTKGLSKRHNDIDKDMFLTVLTKGRIGGGFNQGVRVRDSSVMTYVQERAALTHFYGKRKGPTSQQGAYGSVKGLDHQTTIQSPTWIRVGNILSSASSPDWLR